MVRERKGGPGTISCTTNVNGALLSLQAAHIINQHWNTNVSSTLLSLQTTLNSSQYCTIAVAESAVGGCLPLALVLSSQKRLQVAGLLSRLLHSPIQQNAYGSSLH